MAYQPSSCSTSSGDSSSTVSSQSGGGGAGTGKMPLCATYSVSLICRPSSSVPSSRSSSYCTSAASWRTSSTCAPHLLPDPDPDPNPSRSRSGSRSPSRSPSPGPNSSTCAPCLEPRSRPPAGTSTSLPRLSVAPSRKKDLSPNWARLGSGSGSGSRLGSGLGRGLGKAKGDGSGRGRPPAQSAPPWPRRSPWPPPPLGVLLPRRLDACKLEEDGRSRRVIGGVQWGRWGGWGRGVEGDCRRLGLTGTPTQETKDLWRMTLPLL